MKKNKETDQTLFEDGYDEDMANRDDYRWDKEYSEKALRKWVDHKDQDLEAKQKLNAAYEKNIELMDRLIELQEKFDRSGIPSGPIRNEGA